MTTMNSGPVGRYATDGIDWRRLIAGVGVVIVSWAVLEALEPLMVQLALEATGGARAAEQNGLTLHRYLTIGTVRTLWWLAVALLVARVTAGRPTELVWRYRRSAADLAAGVAIGTVAITAVIALIVAAGAARIVPPEKTGALPSTAAAWLLGEVLIAASEELLFRAALFVLIRRWLGYRAALMLSALLFAAAHGVLAADPVFGLHLVIAGIVLGIALARSRAIWLPIGCHTGWNWGCAMLFGGINSGQANAARIFGFVGTGPPWLDGGTIGPEGSVLALIGNVTELLLVLWWTRRSEWRSSAT